MPLRKFRRKTLLRTEEPRIRQKSIWGLIETRHRAKVNSALPRLAPKPPGLVVLLNGSHMSPPAWPHSSNPHPSCQPAFAKRLARGLRPCLACGPQSSPGPSLSCLSSLGFGLSFERVTSKRTCLPKAQPDQGRLLLGQIPGGWGQRPHCSPDPQTPPNALGIRSLSFPSSVLYRPQLFATGSSPGPSFRRGWGAGGWGAAVPPSTTTIPPLDSQEL